LGIDERCWHGWEGVLVLRVIQERRKQGPSKPAGQSTSLLVDYDYTGYTLDRTGGIMV